MRNQFSLQANSVVTEANINYYSTPFTHPIRKMGDTDLIYVLDGEWKIGQDDESFSLKKDSLLILKAHHIHYGISPCKKDTKTMYFHVNEGIGLNEGTVFIDSLIDASGRRSIKKIFYDIVSSKLSGDDDRASVLYKLLLCELRDTKPFAAEREIGQKIKDMIHRNPECFLSNSEISEKLGISVKTAENKFKALFGTTIHSYILSFKIEKAIQYIKNFPEMQIKEIALNLGFYDEYHFSKQFKKLVGVSPSQYKKSL